MTAVRIRDIDVIALSDGVGKLPKVHFRHADWSARESLLAADTGRYTSRSGASSCAPAM